MEYFVWKITILWKKIIFFPILEGRALGGSSPLDPPLRCFVQKSEYSLREHYWFLRYNEERTIIQFRYTIERWRTKFLIWRYYILIDIETICFNQLLFKYKIVYKAIVRHNSETIDNQNITVNITLHHLNVIDRILFNKAFFRKIFLKDKMRRFFKENQPWMNSTAFRIWWPPQNKSEYKLRTSCEIKRKYNPYAKAVSILLLQCEKFVMAKLKSSVLS